MNRYRKTIKILVLILVLFISIVNINLDLTDPHSMGMIMARASGEMLNVGAGFEYSSIQAAINDAVPGDRIYISNGTYNERLNIQEQLIITGENSNGTIIQPDGTGNIITISGAGISISNLTIQSEGTNYNDNRIEISYSTDCVLSDLVIRSNNNYGVSITDCYNITIKNSIFITNSDGIILKSSDHCNVFRNYFGDNSDGITLRMSNYTQIESNIFNNTEKSGISIRESYYNRVINNTGSNNNIFLDLISSKENYIMYNMVYGNSEGFYLLGSQNNTVSNNTILYNDLGIYFTYSSNNFIINNNCSYNSYGIQMDYSNNNKIINNSLFNNSEIGIFSRAGMNLSILNNTLVHCGLYISGEMDDPWYWYFEYEPYYSYPQKDVSAYWNTHEIPTNNTVNGKPIYYLKNNHNITVPEDAGQVILASCSNIAVRNLSITNCTVGILLGYSDDCTIDNNSLSFSTRYGVLTHSSNNNTIENNKIQYISGDGIKLYNSSKNRVLHNNLTNNYCSIELFYSHKNTIENNSVCNEYFSNSFSFRLIYSNINNIINNSIIINSSGLLLSYCTKIDLKDNYLKYIGDLSSQDVIGIDISSSTYVYLKNNEILNFEIIFRDQSILDWVSHDIDDSNTVNGQPIAFFKNQSNILVPSGAHQVILVNCTNVRIINQNISGTIKSMNEFGYGIMVAYSSKILIKNNSVSNYYQCMYLYKSDNCTITNNSIFNNDLGINLIQSENITISNNMIHNISIGAINLGNSKYDHISGNIIQNCELGIDIVGSNNNVINNNIISLNYWPVRVTYSSHCLIDKNDIFDNKYGLNIENSNFNEITNNTIYKNQFYGLELSYANENIIRNNTIFLIDGINILVHFESKNNLIYHNNIFDNIEPAYDFEGLNRWNNNYPLGGNFWNNYSGIDKFSGDNQNNPGGDGIGDIPYKIIGPNRGVQDQYPLMDPVPVITSLLLLPTNPINVKIYSGEGYCNISWSKPVFDGGSAITKYHIYRGLGPSSIDYYFEVSSDNDGLYFNDTNFENNATHYYSITAVNELGEGPNSTTVTAKPIITVEPKPDKSKDDPGDGFELDYRDIILIMIVLMAIFIILIKLSSRKKRSPVTKNDDKKRSKNN